MDYLFLRRSITMCRGANAICSAIWELDTGHWGLSLMGASNVAQYYILWWAEPATVLEGSLPLKWCQRRWWWWACHRFLVHHQLRVIFATLSSLVVCYSVWVWDFSPPRDEAQSQSNAHKAQKHLYLRILQGPSPSLFSSPKDKPESWKIFPSQPNPLQCISKLISSCSPWFFHLQFHLQGRFFISKGWYVHLHLQR